MTVDAGEHRRFALWVARRYRARDHDDVAGEALLGLVKAAAAHDPTRGAFVSLAGVVCRQRALEEALRQRKREGRETSLYVVSENGDEIERSDLPHVDPPDGSGLMARRLWQELGRLDARSREVLVRRFGLDGEPATLAEVGRGLDLSRERVRQIEAKAVRTLRRRLSR